VATTERGAIPVETRDKIDWVDEHSDATIVTGAYAEIPYSYFFGRRELLEEIQVKEISVSPDDWCEPRETTHRAAIAALCEANEWSFDSAEKTGEKD
jgi:hypothetical protein